jgi:transcriptional regulator with XRE-family HTH domain
VRYAVLMKSRVFPALLKSWRHRRGLSQLDLALIAEMSPRHLSFLETGRSQPSSEMVLRLCNALDVPLRERNTLLSAADHPAHYPEAEREVMPAEIERVVDRMCAQQEPYPLLVLNSTYDVLRTNTAAALLVQHFVVDTTALVPPINLFDLTFDARLARPFVVDWQGAARDLIGRLHREVLAHPGDARRSELLARVLAMPDVPRPFCQPDLERDAAPVLALQLQRDDVRVSFIAAVTAFSAPQNVTLDELRIESWFPADDATAAWCAMHLRPSGALDG